MAKSIPFLPFLLLPFGQGLSGQQFSNGVQMDTLPRIHMNKDISMLDEIRCATYLFVKDFRVRDSLGNIYVSLYYPDDNHQTTPESIYVTNSVIFQTAYYLALFPRLELIQRLYNDIIINSYDRYGQLLHTKTFPIGYHRPHNPKEFLITILNSLRIPNTWTVNKDQFQIIYYCIDLSERKVFYNPLIHTLKNLKLLDKAYKSWMEVYSSCDLSQKDTKAIIKLPK